MHNTHLHKLFIDNFFKGAENFGTVWSLTLKKRKVYIESENKKSWHGGGTEKRS